eukprot:684928-Prorocentrum_minimum.AAC.1
MTPPGFCAWFGCVRAVIDAVFLQTVTLKVDMMCEGCAGAVRRILQKIEGRLEHCPTHLWKRSPDDMGIICNFLLSGVENIEITVADNKVVVTGSNLDPNLLLEKVAKSGKATEMWPTA